MPPVLLGSFRRAALLWSAAASIATMLLPSDAAAAGARAPTASPAAAPAPASQKKLDLPALIQLARSRYPGIEAARQAVLAMRAKLYQAKWGSLPQGEVKGLFAPAPNVECQPGTLYDTNGKPVLLDGAPVVNSCAATNHSLTLDSFRWGGIMVQIGLEAAMPLYTFGKLSSAEAAATAGVEAKQALVQKSEHDLTFNVARAYWGLKLAKEILYTIKEGRTYLDKAITKLKGDLENDEGDYTYSDLYRLEAAAAEVDARTQEAEKLQTLSLAGLKLLTGQENQALELDDDVLTLHDTRLRPLNDYIDFALRGRPDLSALRAANRAADAGVALEKAKFYPDIALVGSLGYAVAPSVDVPRHAFYTNPFNYFSGGFGLALKWKWDQVQQYGRLKDARATASETRSLQKEAAIGVKVEITEAYVSLKEARERLAARERGAKATKRWLTATAQGLQMGSSEPKDLNDALVGYFTQEITRLQAIFDVNLGWWKLAKVSGQEKSQLGAP